MTSINLLPPIIGRLLLGCLAPALLLSACSLQGAGTMQSSLAPQLIQTPAPAEASAPAPSGGGPINAQIGRYAALYHVPEALIRRIIVRESGYNPGARHGAYWGLMQIRYDTARSMGYGGPPSGLLDADINLRYGVKYLAGAYKVASGDPEKAVSFYTTGYYYDARRQGLLDEVGLKRSK